MSMSEKKSEKFVTTWVTVLFVIAVCVSYVFIQKRIDVILGLTIGTLVSLLKFLINSYNFSKILANRMPNVFSLILTNVFTLIVLFLLLYLFLNKLNLINIYTIVGILIGAGFIPLVILAGGILQSLYIIRNKF